MAQRTYKSDKIVEALCEIRFIPHGEWDPTVFGSYYDLIKNEFPKKQTQEVRRFELRAEESAIKQSFCPPELRMRFLAPDDSAMIQLARNLLVVNILRAYPSWGKFKPLILKRVQDYSKAADTKGIQRLGLRYINRYEFPTSDFDAQALFNVYPCVPKEINGRARPFFMRVEHPYSDSERLVLTFGETDSGRKDVVAVLLDLDHVFLNLEGMELPDLGDKLELAHDRVQGAFETCITDRIRALLGGE